MFLHSCVHITDEESAEFCEVLIMDAAFFAKNDTDFGCFAEMEHTIDTGDTPPINSEWEELPCASMMKKRLIFKKCQIAKSCSPPTLSGLLPLSSSGRKMALFAGPLISVPLTLLLRNISFHCPCRMSPCPWRCTVFEYFGHGFWLLPVCHGLTR